MNNGVSHTAEFVPKNIGKGKLLTLDQVAERLGRDVYDVGEPHKSERYHDRSTVIVCPTRGLIDTRVIDSWRALIHAMNQKRVELFARGFEVGAAYNRLVRGILDHEHLKNWRFILTIEEDNLPPPDGHLKLLECLEEHPEFSAVAGLYHLKNAARLPMAYGDPAEFRRTGRTDYAPISRDLLDPEGGPVEVVGIPMGFTLWRTSLFREVPEPWYATLDRKILTRDGKLVDHDEVTTEQAVDAKRCMTQDMYFCERAARLGHRFAVLPSVQVGHLDVENGMVY